MANCRSPQSDTSCKSSAARIGALAVLPVFFNLRGKKVLVIGGGEPAVWKAELLAQAGADVDVIAPDACSEMFDLTTQSGLHGSVNLFAREWSLKDLEHKTLVVADAATEGEAKAIYCAARSAGIPVNIVDNPEFCTFQFGSIVNRSPVVIGISTDGAAPILGQTVRARIESILPPALADWAAFAKEVRATVLSRFSPGAERRAFWSKFAGLAFGPFNKETAWISCAAGSGAEELNKITVLCVNPDDFSELTLRSVSVLQSAGMIVYDSRVNPKILELARREAVRREVEVGGDIDNRIKQLHRILNSEEKQLKSVLLVVANTSDDAFSAKIPSEKLADFRVTEVIPVAASVTHL
jgi:uroporphyrin-III C-methyltransferase / precorrin-2 dehydrogenase / sirohydrochlorin ferrochelatase